MAQSSVTVSREKLYQEVWQTPIHRLAPHYGLSDVGLKKICKKLHVPTPPRGYWMRIKAGEKIRCPPLPPLKYGQPSVLSYKFVDKVVPSVYSGEKGGSTCLQVVHLLPLT